MPVSPHKIAEIPLFQSLTGDDCVLISRYAWERTYAKGEIIAFEGDSESPLYFVVNGLVKVYKISEDGKEQVLRMVGRGRTFNDAPAFDGQPNPASVMAVEATHVIVLGQRELNQIISLRPAVALGVIRNFSHALRHLVALVEDLSLRDVVARAAHLLIMQKFDADTKLHHLTQQEMASMIGAAREVTGRALKKIEQTGAIKINRGQITILDDSLLESIVRGQSAIHIRQNEDI